MGDTAVRTPCAPQWGLIHISYNGVFKSVRAWRRRRARFVWCLPRGRSPPPSQTGRCSGSRRPQLVKERAGCRFFLGTDGWALRRERRPGAAPSARRRHVFAFAVLTLHSEAASEEAGACSSSLPLCHDNLLSTKEKEVNKSQWDVDLVLSAPHE